MQKMTYVRCFEFLFIKNQFIKNFFSLLKKFNLINSLSEKILLFEMV